MGKGGRVAGRPAARRGDESAAAALEAAGLHRTRWNVSQYMSRGCAAATAMVRYMRSWFRAPRTGTPSAAASARIFSLNVRIWGPKGQHWGKGKDKDRSRGQSLPLRGLRLPLRRACGTGSAQEVRAQDKTVPARPEGRGPSCPHPDRVLTLGTQGLA